MTHGKKETILGVQIYTVKQWPRYLVLEFRPTLIATNIWGRIKPSFIMTQNRGGT